MELLPKPYTSLLFLARCRWPPALLSEVLSWDTARHRGDGEVAFAAGCYDATLRRLEALGDGLVVAPLPPWVARLCGFKRQGAVLGGLEPVEAERQVGRQVLFVAFSMLFPWFSWCFRAFPSLDEGSTALQKGRAKRRWSVSCRSCPRQAH